MVDEEEPNWFEIVSGPALEQGDLLPGCMIPLIPTPSPDAEEGAEVEGDIEVHDVCVLTQSCDLENDKVKNVLLGRVLSWAAVVEAKREAGDTAFASKRTREGVQRGQLPGMCLLHRRQENPVLPWSVVDFHALFVLPKSYVVSHAKGIGERLRLRSPYKEHLAQAFARYFMRVGLPHDAKAFVKDSG